MILKGFTKVNEYGDPELIKPSELVELENYTIDGGKLVRRENLDTYGAQAASGIKSLFRVVKDSTVYILAVIGTALKKSQGGGAWSNVITGLTSDKKGKMVSYYGNYYFTNNNENVYYTDLTDQYDLGIESLDVTGISVAVGAGGNLEDDGKYKWAIVYYYNGSISKTYRPITGSDSSIDNGIGTGDTKVTFTNIPAPTDSRVTSIRIYRTKNGGNVYYLVDSIDTDETTFEDTIADTELSTADILPTVWLPDKAKHIEIHRDRLFLANITKTYSPTEIPAYFEKFGVNTVTDVDSESNPIGTGLDDGTYRWKYAFMNDEGKQSALNDNYLEYTVTFNADNSQTSDATVVLHGLPWNIEDDTKWLVVYRTKAGETTPYYYVGRYLQTISDVEVRDSLNDTELRYTYPYGEGVESTTNKDEILWSEIGNPSNIKGINSLRVFAGNGGAITGIIDNFDGLLVFKEDLIAKVYTEGSPYNWQVLRVSENIGAEENSIAVIDRTVYFIHNNRAYRYGRGIEEIGVEFRDTLDSIDSIQGATYSKNRNWYVLLVTIDSSSYILVYDENIGSWYKFSIGYSGADLQDVITDDGELIFGDGDGYMRKFGVGDTDSYNSAAYDITGTIKSKVFQSEQGNKIRLRKLIAEYEKQVINASIKIEDTFNSADRTYTDSTGSGKKFVNKPTDALTNSLKVAEKVQFTISDVKSLNYLKLINYELDRGRLG